MSGSPPTRSSRAASPTPRECLAAELALAVVRAEKRQGRTLDRGALAKRLNVSVSSVYAYLNGTTLAGSAVFDALLDALGVTGTEAGRLATLRDAADAARRARPAPSRSAPPPAPVPRQLPPGCPYFVGRESELRALDGLLPGGENTAGTSAVAVIDGTAGVGKTSLALAWAHRVKDRFPDGQLYVNLQGFAPGAPTGPAEALHGFLLALGVAPAAIPATTEAAAALLRSVLSQRRALVLLDNARSADQVRPLLPGTPDCPAIVTSRNRLDGLVVREGARRVTLGVLPRPDALALLECRVDAAALAREPGASAELVDLCARLPLALSLAAARLTGDAPDSVGTLVGELRQAHARLDTLDIQSPDADLRAVFRQSYDLLPAAAARLFRLLGVHPGPDADGHACAALLGTSAPPRALLDVLVREHLVHRSAPGRYALHDLLRLYARERAEHEPRRERRAATERMLDHYLGTARRAGRYLEPWRPGEPATAPAPDRPEPPPASYGQAMEWFEAESDTLRAVIDLAAADGFEPYAWQLAWACAVFLRRSGRRAQRAHVQGVARQAAARAGDRAALATSTRLLADALCRLDRGTESLRLLAEALTECRNLGDDDGRRQVHLSYVRVHAARGDHPSALRHAEDALRLAEHGGDPLARADGLTAVAQQRVRLGRYADALGLAERALSHYRLLGHAEGEASILLALGQAEQGLGRHAEAAVRYQRSLEHDRALGDRFWEARALGHLADARRALGDEAGFRALRRQARAVLDALGRPDAPPRPGW